MQERAKRKSAHGQENRTDGHQPEHWQGWTDAEETTFTQIIGVGRMDRIEAIQLFRRCKSDHAKAAELTRKQLRSDGQVAAYENTKDLLDWQRRTRDAHRIGGFNVQNAQPEDFGVIRGVKGLGSRVRCSAVSVSRDTGALVNALGWRGHVSEPFRSQSQ
jgi:hypothetical protein